MSTTPPDLRVGSLFSGVGGIDMGLERAGMRVVWQVEKDRQCRAVLRRHWPDVTLYEDVRDVGGANLAPVDLICGGFPCQDVSVAGRRAGLAGERSGLWWEFHRVVRELAPRWVLIENVPGLLSSNGGRDLAAILHGLAQLGYWWTYRILDARHFGVPQRRRRVFIVGHLGAPCPPEVLLEPESLPWDPAPCAEAWAGVAGAVARRPGGTGADDDDARGGRAVATALRGGDAKGSPDSDCTQTLVAFNPTAGTRDVQAGPLSPPLRVGSGLDIPSGPAVVAHTLRAEGYDAGEDTHVVPALTAKMAKGTGGPAGDEVQNIIIEEAPIQAGDLAHTLRAEGFDASEDGTGRGTPIVVSETGKGWWTEGASALRADPGGMPSHIAFTCQDSGQYAGDLAPTLRAMPHDASHPNGGGQVAVAFDWQSGGDCRGLKPSPVVGALHVGQRPATMEGMQAIPRRLTPTECERLMGWPDGWTAWGVDERGQRVEMADGPRYRMCGNGVVSTVAEWIGRRIVAADRAAYADAKEAAA